MGGVGGAEIFETFVNVSERCGCVKHGIPMANWGDVWDRVRSERDAGGLEARVLETVEDIMAGSRQVNIGAVKIIVSIQIEVIAAIVGEILELLRKLVLRHVIREEWRLTGSARGVQLRTGRVFKLKMLLAKHIDLGVVWISWEADLMLGLSIEIGGLVFSAHVNILLRGVDDVPIAAWSADIGSLRSGQTGVVCLLLPVLAVVL